MRALLAGLLLLASCSKDIDDYKRRQKTEEAQVALIRLTQVAKVHGDASKEFPKGTIGPTPAQSCCAQKDGVCLPDLEQWKGGMWEFLGFAVDTPHRFQYSYASDGKTFTVTAIADLDCDGRLTTVVAGGTITETGGVVIDDSQIRLKKKK